VLGEVDLEKVVEERLVDYLMVAACCVGERGYIPVELGERRRTGSAVVVVVVKGTYRTLVGNSITALQRWN